MVQKGVTLMACHFKMIHIKILMHLSAIITYHYSCHLSICSYLHCDLPILTSGTHVYDTLSFFSMLCFVHQGKKAKSPAKKAKPPAVNIKWIVMGIKPVKIG